MSVLIQGKSKAAGIKSFELTCSSRLRWEPTSVQCVSDAEMTCNEPPFDPQDEFIRRVLPARYIYGEVATYSCSPGDTSEA